MDEQEDITRLQPGTILDGKYRVTGYLGRGGMGSVYRAVHTQLGNEVAIKVLHPRFAQDQIQLTRFQREAQIISALHHKNILAVHAFSLWDGHAYMAIEFVNGESLREFVNERGPLKMDIAIPMLVQICDAMEFAHKHDVLHRDLKPDNVLVVKAEAAVVPEVKVVDFGLAKLLGNEDMQKLTRTGQVVGDPHYMSPEQCQGMELDARSDIYSFGCLMYEVFAGCRAFQSESPVATMYQHLQNDPAPFAKPLGLPAPLESIVFRAMEKKPKDRYQTFTDVAHDLRELADNPLVKIDRQSTTSPMQRLWRQLRSSNDRTASSIRIGAIAMLILIPLVAVGAVMLLRPKQDIATEGDPYAHLSAPEIRARVAPLLTQARNLGHLRKFDEAEHFLTEASRLRDHLQGDPLTEGLVDYQYGEHSFELFRYKHSTQAADDAKRYLRKSADEIALAKKLLQSGKQTQMDTRKFLSDIDLNHIATLDMLLQVGFETEDSPLTEWVATEILQLLENRQEKIDYTRAHACQKCFNWLFAHNLNLRKPDVAAELIMRRLRFCQRQDCAEEFVSRETESMLDSLEKASPQLARSTRAKLAKESKSRTNANPDKQKHHPN